MAGLALAWVLAGVAIAAGATAAARSYALRRRLIDEPGERRSHQAATPRGGGISIVLVLLAALAAMATAFPAAWPACLLAGAGLALVAGIGWLDDHRPLSPLLRLGVHALAAILLAGALWTRGASVLDLAFACGAALVLVNVWNFMDGIDGIAAGQALVVALAWILLAGQGAVWWAGLALAAGIIGFLPYNFPRARIFLGDVGSGALGYALAALFAWGSAGEALHGRLLWSLPLLPFLLDASLTLASRILAGEAWWRPHVTHAYQAWARSAGSHVPVTLAYVAAATVAALAMFAVRSGTATIIITVWLVVVTSGALAWKTLRGAAAAPTTGKVGKGNR